MISALICSGIFATFVSSTIVLRREDTVLEELHLDVAAFVACIARLVFLGDKKVHDAVSKQGVKSFDLVEQTAFNQIV